MKRPVHRIRAVGPATKGVPLSGKTAVDNGFRSTDINNVSQAVVQPTVTTGGTEGDVANSSPGSYPNGTFLGRQWGYGTSTTAPPFTSISGETNETLDAIPVGVAGKYLFLAEQWSVDGDVIFLYSDGVGPIAQSGAPGRYVEQSISAGAGFAGVTADPGAQGPGTNFAKDWKPVGRWTWPPYDEFVANRRVGIIAFHPSGIQKVRFILDGGTAVDVTEESTNPDTGVKEYYVNLTPSAYADKQNRELRAIVYPVDGPCRILQGWTVYNEGVAGTAAEQVEGEHSLWFASNATDTLPKGVQYVDPVNGNDTNNGLTAGAAKLTHHAASKTLSTNMSGSSGGSSTSDNGGGIIYLLPGNHYIGTYAFPDPRQKYRWLTVKPAPGVDKSQCPVFGHANYASSGAGLRGNHVRYEGLMILCPVSLADTNNKLTSWPFKTPTTVSNPFGSGNSIPHMWFKDCTWDYGAAGNSWWEQSFDPSDCEIQYRTNCVTQNVRLPYSANKRCKLVLGCTFYNSTEACSGAGVIANCTFALVQLCQAIPPETPPQNYPHSDVYQIYTQSGSQRAENRAIVGNSATFNIDGQGFFVNPDTGSPRAREVLFRGNTVRRKSGSTWNVAVAGSLTDAIWWVDNNMEGNRNVSASATTVMYRNMKEAADGTQFWAYPAGSGTSDQVVWAGAGSPSFPWTASGGSGVRYEN